MKGIPPKFFALLYQGSGSARANPLPAFVATLTLDLYEKQTLL
jgi:hypothetical protein